MMPDDEAVFDRGFYVRLRKKSRIICMLKPFFEGFGTYPTIQEQVLGWKKANRLTLGGPLLRVNETHLWAPLFQPIKKTHLSARSPLGPEAFRSDQRDPLGTRCARENAPPHSRARAGPLETTQGPRD